MTTFPINRKEVERLCATGETVLNYVGYIFPLSTVGLRAALATVQIAAGFFMAAKEACEALAKSEEEQAKEFRQGYTDLAFVVHGLANKIRSVVQAQLFFPLSLAMAVWDFSGMRIKYSVEEKVSGRELSMDMVTSSIKWLRLEAEKLAELVESLSRR